MDFWAGLCSMSRAAAFFSFCLFKMIFDIFESFFPCEIVKRADIAGQRYAIALDGTTRRAVSFFIKFFLPLVFFSCKRGFNLCDFHLLFSFCLFKMIFDIFECRFVVAAEKGKGTFLAIYPIAVNALAGIFSCFFSCPAKINDVCFAFFFNRAIFINSDFVFW